MTDSTARTFGAATDAGDSATATPQHEGADSFSRTGIRWHRDQPAAREDEDPVEFLAERGYDFRLFENSDPVAERWGIRATPGLFLVDDSGLAVFSNYAVPEDAFRTDAADEGRQLKHYQRAARKAPVWAAALRQAIDQMQP